MTTFVAVEVYGAPVKGSIQAGLILGFISGVGVLLYASFRWPKYQRHKNGLGPINVVQGGIGSFKSQMSQMSNIGGMATQAKME